MSVSGCISYSEEGGVWQMPYGRMDGRWSNNRIKALVTLGLGAGYVITIRSNIRSGHRASAIGNSILLPASLVWLWIVTDRHDE